MKEKDGGWSPYLAGALAGLLAVLSVWATTEILGSPKYFGASTTFVRAAGIVEKGFVPEHVANNEYFRSTKVKVDWQFLFVLCIFIGALLSSRMDGSFQSEKVPPVWSDRFGSRVGVRAAGAFLGGILAIFGARLAGGCPSGHGISGMMQLSLSGLIALVCFFLGGIVVARIVYGGGKK